MRSHRDTALIVSQLVNKTPDAPAPSEAIPSSELFSVFFRIGVMSLGGGASGWIHREVVSRRGWLTDEEFLAGVAIAQVLPGVNTTNITVYVGHRVGGWGGALIALTGFLFGPFWIAIVAAVSYHRFLALPGFDAAMLGVAAVALGIVLRVAVLSARVCLKSAAHTIVMVAAFVSVGLLHWPLAPVVLILAPISIFASRPRQQQPNA
jgi:chromate transporter